MTPPESAPTGAEAHYRARGAVIEAEHRVEEDRARLNQLEHDNNATAEDIAEMSRLVEQGMRAGAFTASGYFLVGRNLRARMSLLAYIWVSYTTAAALLLAGAALAGVQLLGFAAHTYLLVLALAVGPQLLGHTAFNWALRYLSATFIAVTIALTFGQSFLKATSIRWDHFATRFLVVFAACQFDGSVHVVAVLEHQHRR